MFTIKASFKFVALAFTLSFFNIQSHMTQSIYEALVNLAQLPDNEKPKISKQLIKKNEVCLKSSILYVLHIESWRCINALYNPINDEIKVAYVYESGSGIGSIDNLPKEIFGYLEKAYKEQEERKNKNSTNAN